MPGTTNTETRLPSQASTMRGYSGTTIFKGYITGEEYNQKLIGTSGLRIYDRMRNDATVRQLLQTCKLPLLSTEFYYSPPKNDPIAQEKKDFIEHELFRNNVNFHQLKKDSLLMLDFGYSLFEFTLQLTEFEGKTRIGIKSIEWRKPTSILRWETEDEQPGVTQQLQAGGTASIEEIRLLRFTNDQEGQNYVGKSILRYVFKNWDIREKLEIVDAIKHEKQGLGVVKIKTGVNGIDADPQAISDAEDAARNFRANEEGFVREPAGIELELMNMQAGSTTDMLPSMNYHDSRIMKSGLAGFLEIGGQSGSGSQSLSKDLSSFFMKSEESIAKTICNSIMENLVKLLLNLNYTDNSYGYGELAFGAISDEDPTVLSSSLKAFNEAGLLTPDMELEEHIRKVANLPAMSDELKAKYEEIHAAPIVADPATVPIDKKAKDALDQEDSTKKAEKDIKATLATAKELVRQIDVHYVG